MKIPLTAFIQKNEEEGNEKLLIYSNGNQIKIDLPFSPFILAEANKFPELTGNTETWTKVPQHTPTDYFRINFRTNKEYYDVIKKYSDRKRYIFNNNYIDQLLISHPDYFLNYPNTNNLKIMYFDIEVVTRGDGYFPRPITNEVLCIGYSIWEYNNIGEKRKIKQDIIKGFNENTKDSNILTNFKQVIINEDPDIIAGYNSESFDFPYLIDRFELMKIDTNGIGRNNRKIYKYKNQIIIPGRIHFDIYNSNAGVTKDQTLTEVKSKTLKDLARFYKVNIEDIELPDEISNLYKLYQENPEKLYSYQNDDVLRTEHVGNVYIRNCITLAEMMGCPLDSIVTMFSSFIPKLIMAREMESLRLINTETNFQKYNSVNGSICQFRKFDGKELKYQGAIVGLYKAGFFDNVNKLDFSSQYPSAIQTWNIGPDTVSLVEVRPYTGKYSFTQDSSYNWYVIPDANFNCDIVIKVKNNVNSFLKTKIGILKAERKKIKKEQKICPPEEWEILNSQQNAIKVILNSIYGFFGLKTTSYGDTICGLLVTGLCRWTTTNVMQWLADDLVETDSVVGDTPIYVRDKHSGDINIIPIEDLHRSNLKRKKYSGNYEILTRNGWKNIKYTKKHSVKKDIHRVKISDGYVDVTSDHSLFTTNKKEVAPKNIIVNTTNIETIYNPITSSILPKFDNEFCWLLGFLIAEGSVYEGYTKTGKEKRQVSFNGNNIELMRRVEYLSNKYFNKPEFGNSKFRLHNTMSSSAVYKVQGGYNKIICDWLKENCYTLNRKDKKIPIFIINGTNNMKSSFLDGIMIGDGYNVITKDNRKIESLDSKFKSLSAGIRYLWNSLGHKTICVVRSDKLNITTYRKRVEYKSGKLRNINTNIVLQNNIISKSETVYDVSTDDGTFVTALGNIVLHNTDGLILDKTVNDIDINKKLTDLIKTRFGLKENYMEMELENFGRAFFYKTKNYVVEEDGKYIKHGVSMKSSKVSKVIDRAVDLAIEHWFNNKPIEEVIREAYNFKNLGLEWFEERVKLSKEQIEYDDQTDMKLLLAKQMEMKTGQICEQGMQISYFVTKDQLPFKELRDYYKKTSIWNYTFSKYVESIKDLNLAYYEKMIDKVLDRFDIHRIEQTDFLSQLDIKKKSKVELDIIPMEKV